VLTPIFKAGQLQLKDILWLDPEETELDILQFEAFYIVAAEI